jgi:hypothetical protein
MPVTQGKTTVRCPVCGKSGERHAFVKGALGAHMIEVLTQYFRGAGNGLDRDGNWPRGEDGRYKTGRAVGGMVWEHARPDSYDIEMLARAVATAGQRVVDMLDGKLPLIDGAQVLATVEDDNEALRVSYDWVADSERETERRRSVVAEDLRRRGMIE